MRKTINYLGAFINLTASILWFRNYFMSNDLRDLILGFAFLTFTMQLLTVALTDGK